MVSGVSGFTYFLLLDKVHLISSEHTYTTDFKTFRSLLPTNNIFSLFSTTSAHSFGTTENRKKTRETRVKYREKDMDSARLHLSST